MGSFRDATGTEKLVLKRGNLFAVTGRLGDVFPPGARDQGAYFEDTRFLSTLKLTVAGGPNVKVSGEVLFATVLVRRVRTRNGSRLEIRSPKRELSIFLDASDFKIEESDSGKQAVRMCASIKPDLILLDLGLPDKDGLEILKQWRTANRKTPVLILTARAE